MVGVVEVEPAPVGQWSELVRSGGAGRVESGVGGKRAAARWTAARPVKPAR